MIPKRDEWVKARDAAGGKANLVSGVSVGDLLAAVHKKRGTLPLGKAMQASARETKALADGLKKYRAASAVKKNPKLAAVVDKIMTAVASEPEQLRKLAEEHQANAARERRRAEEHQADEQRRADEQRAKEQQAARQSHAADRFKETTRLLNEVIRQCQAVQAGDADAFRLAAMNLSMVGDSLRTVADLKVADAHAKAWAMWQQNAPSPSIADELPPRHAKRAAEELRELAARVLALVESAPPA